MPEKPLESDWKTFSKRLCEWRERYLEAKNQEILKVLVDEARTPTERFWDTYNMMRSEGRILKDCLDGASRSRMWLMMIGLYGSGFIGEKDLDEFSPGLRERTLAAFRHREGEAGGLK